MSDVRFSVSARAVLFVLIPARAWNEAVAVEALHRISPDEYRRLIEAGIFDEDWRQHLAT